VFGGDPVVLYGLPIAKMVATLGVATAIGALGLAVFALDPQEGEYGFALDVAAAGAAVWTVAGAITAFFTYSSVYQNQLRFDEAAGQELATFLTEQPFGRAWLVYVLVGALLTVVCFAVRNQTLLGVAVIAAVLGLIPIAADGGHAADASSHDQAVTAIWLHTTFAALWVGGLITLAVSRGTLTPQRLAAVLPRYSTIALICFVVVASSGYLSAAIRVGDLPSLLTPYGALVLAKVGAIGVLGGFGVWQRRVLVKKIVATPKLGATTSRWFWVLVTTELAFMGIASGVAAALARTANPVSTQRDPDVPLTPAELLTDKPLPPELTPDRWITSWNLDLLWVLVVGFGILFYLAGVWRLHRRGDRWPIHRTVLWIIGMLGLLWITNGALNVYEQFLFSAHMMAHMLLSMTVPVLLVLSAPITLGMRTIRKRDDGSRGAREWMLYLVHSKVATVLTHPLVAGGLFAASLWVFYYTPLFRWATVDHVGHTWMIIHFLITGYLFAQALVGVDPVATRPPYPLRLVLLLATMALHAFFGLSLMTGTGLLLADWYGAMGRTWGANPLLDQQNAGGIAWSVGEIPTVVLAILVALMWSRSDERDAKRQDRAADRDGDAELSAYNEMLAGRAKRPAP
jgi:cytochrome c oxidase assembly factor CtaG/putative copper export protein